MILENELRIGNHVYEVYKGERKVVVYNFALHEHLDINGFTVYDSVSGFDNFTTLEPIPLQNEFSVDLKVKIGNLEFSELFKNCKYVHQAENLCFALTGHELGLKDK